jgi:hypothetical protein
MNSHLPVVDMLRETHDQLHAYSENIMNKFTDLSILVVDKKRYSALQVWQLMLLNR